MLRQNQHERDLCSKLGVMASAFALAELIAGLTIGQFLARDRAEIAIFLAFRPWLLPVLALAVRAWPRRRRYFGYAGAIILASASETLLAALLGNPDPLLDAARAIVAGLLLAALLDGFFAIARRVEPRFAAMLGALLAIGVLLVPGPLRLYERIALAAPPPRVAGPRPAVSLLTGLPMRWGEGGPLTGGPNSSYRRLAAEFRLRPIDAATPETLSQAPLLLAAQPRELSADEIDSIDRWVRMGGRALLLVDPDLRWPSDLPPGDARRPPRWATLAPLLARWGVTVARQEAGIATIDFGRRRIVTDTPGRLRLERGCRPLTEDHAATCRIGRGTAIILADGDMLDDRLWVTSSPSGDSRLARAGDNAVLLAEWLDRLAANPRRRPGESVAWQRRGGAGWGIVAALLPLLLLGGIAVRNLSANSHG